MGRVKNIVQLETFFGTDDLDYLAWGKRLDSMLIEKYGLGVLDLPKIDYSEYYLDGLNEDEAFETVVDILREEHEIE